LNESKRTPLYTQVRDYVLDHIKAGKWREGSRLPSENQLCKMFDVSRITIRSAMDKLVEEGIVYRVQGRGSYVAQFKGEKEPVRYESVSPQLVALLVPEMRGLLITRVAEGVASELEHTRYRMLLLTTGHSQEKEERKLEEAMQAGAKGIIVYPSEGQTYNEKMLKLALNRYPIVVIDRYLRGVETNCVCSDHYAGAYEATTHLLKLGHRRIAFATTPYYGTTSLEERLEGYRQALNDHGVIFDKNRVYEIEEPDDVQAFLSEADMTALFAANEHIGTAAIRAAEACGKSVPGQLSVIFFDDYEYADDARIPPTCVAQQGEQIGREAAKRLLSIMAEPQQARLSIRLPVRLIVRSSTAVPEM